MPTKEQIENGMTGYIRMYQDEIDALAEEAQKGEGDWAEIGTYFGGASILIGQHLPDPHILYTIDPTHARLWKRDDEKNYPNQTQEEIILRNFDNLGLSNKIHFIKAKSYPWPLGSLPLDGIFIDGDHTKRNVTQDCESALNSNARVILVHDYGWRYCREVKPIVDEMIVPKAKKTQLVNTLMICTMR